MAFIPKTWVDDQIVYAEDMNRIEQGIAETDTLLQTKVNTADFQSHTASKSNPHGVTAAQTGAYTKGETDTLLAKKAEASAVSSHISNKSNPHVVTAEQVGAYAKDKTDSLLNNKLSTNLGSIGGDFANLDTVKSPGDYVWLDTKAEIGFAGALYTVRVAAPKYGASGSVTQMMQGTYPASAWIIKVRSYYYASGWTPWRTLATTNDLVKIAIGSYVGTGTYSSANPNSLTFDFEPKVVIIVQNSHDNFPGTVFIRGQTLSGTIGENYISNSQLTVGWSGNTVTWYTNNSSYKDRAQLNISGNTYFYVALG